jgi:DNA (cytosine-5)-methyltransferase 3A
MRILSLFDGISCGQVALERAGIPIEVYYASEIDKYAIAITQKNYPNTIQLGSVTDIDFTEFIGKVDLIMGGSPCQDLSIAGKRKGLSGERSGLFYKFVEAIEIIKPKYFLLENNVGMPKEAYEEISRLMGCYPVMINSALVSAQTRKRYYWTNIGPQELNLFGFPTCKIPQPEDKGILLKDVLEKNTLAPDEKSRAIIGSIGRTTDREYFKKNQGQLVAEPIKIPENTIKGYAEINQGECMDLTHINSTTRRGRAMTEKANCLQTQSEFYQYIKPCALQNRGEGKQPEFNGNDKANALTSVQTDSMVLEPLQLGHIGNTNAQVNRVYSVRNKSVTLKANAGGGGAKTGLYKIDLPDGEYLIRKLTPLECERLQTLPDNYTEGISNTQRCKCIGNGWTVDVIAHIFSFIKEE